MSITFRLGSSLNLVLEWWAVMMERTGFLELLGFVEIRVGNHITMQWGNAVVEKAVDFYLSP